MRLHELRNIKYADQRGPRLGALKDGGFVDLQDAAQAAGREFPCEMRGLIELGEPGLDMAETLVRANPSRPLAPGSLRPPIPDLRKNVVAVGRNYREHLEEGARARGADPVVPDHAVFFTKPPTALIGHDMDIEFDPRATSELDYEAELVVVIGRRGRNIAVEDAYDHIFGYTIGNDISARDAQRAHLQWFKGKGMDTFCPIGPCIVPARDISNPQDLGICLRVNGETRQSARTSLMIFDIATIIHQLSIGLTIEPGDLIMTGTPGGVGLGMDPQRWLADGDVIEAEVDGIGVLRNRVAQVSDARD
jgi:2-keto-4-pentenoate hydratase/2-oxohepta-3-ene-1,7-dioic acid hydratase in catechol pathway